MKNKINKILNLMLLLSILNGNILSMQKSDIEQAGTVMQESSVEPGAQATEIDQGSQQELSLSDLPAEVIECIIYPIIKPYKDRIKDVNNIFEFYSQLDLKQLVSDLRGALLASTELGGVTSGLIKSLLKKKYDELVNPIKAQYQGLSQNLNLSELNSRLRDVLNRFPINRNVLEEAAKLILSGANVNQKNSVGCTALTYAARLGHKDIVQLLIRNRANVNERDNHRFTALMWAAYTGHEDIIQLLINNGANVNEKDNNKSTILMFATNNGNKDIVQLLIGNGANVNEKNVIGETALTRAAVNGHEAIVELLIGNDANVDQKNNDGNTALMLAESHGHEGIVQLLEAVQLSLE